ncbi:hypothetical protein Tco_1027156 [Tanacetum coccineum]
MADTNGNMESGADGSSDPNDSNNDIEARYFTTRYQHALNMILGLKVVDLLVTNRTIYNSSDDSSLAFADSFV